MIRKENQMKPLIEYCKGAVDALKSQYAMTKVLHHGATSGSTRERLIHDFLAAHLPDMTSVVSGIVVDSSGRRSRQQDIVLMLKSMPRLPFSSGDDLIFQEGALATIEIKTGITPHDLEDIARNIQSVQSLESSTKECVQVGDTTWPYFRILSVLITYEGSSLASVGRKLDSIGEGYPDIYLDLTNGILIKNEGLLLPKDGDSTYIRFDDPAVGLARLLTLLSVVTSRMVMRAVKWDNYII